MHNFLSRIARKSKKTKLFLANLPDFFLRLPEPDPPPVDRKQTAEIFFPAINRLFCRLIHSPHPVKNFFNTMWICLVKTRLSFCHSKKSYPQDLSTFDQF